MAASLAGTVRDGATQQPLPGAIISVVELRRFTAATPDGRYRLDALPAGPLHIVVRRLGYRPHAFHALLPASGLLEIDVALLPAPTMLDAIDVRVDPEAAGLEPAAPDGRTVSADAARLDPRLPEIDLFLAAGGGDIALRQESPAGIHVRGGSADHVAYLLDGIPAFSPYHVAGTFSAWIPEALERVDFLVDVPSPGLSETLSGTVLGRTRQPGTALAASGSLSTTQARATLSGPLGRRGAGFVLGYRSVLPGLFAHREESSYLRGEGIDWLAKLEAPLLGGTLSALVFGNENEISPAATPDSAAAVTAPRNQLSWEARAAGLGWRGAIRRVDLLLRLWWSEGDAGALWGGADTTQAPLRLSWHRRETGGLAVVAWMTGAGSGAAGLRLQRDAGQYRAAARREVRAVRPTVFVQHAMHRGPFTAMGGVAATSAAGRWWASPAVSGGWRAGRFELAMALERRHQYSQSLRNPESVASHVFPADLHVDASAGAIPVARAEQALLVVAARPAAGARIELRGFTRGLAGLALTAPVSAGPHADSSFETGRGHARGASLGASLTLKRVRLAARYGLLHARLAWRDSGYTPEHAPRHTLESGLGFTPSASTLLSLSFTAAQGRPVTAVEGPFEWESCNLADHGCEFAGTPRRRPEPLGASGLPRYARLDAGFRKHWHLRVADRQSQLTLFGTVSNVLGRPNAIAVVIDPATGARQLVTARPRAPLVIGLDWQL